MEDDVQEFNFSPQYLTPKYLNSTSAFDIPLVFKASPISPALNARHHTLTIPHGCSSRDLYDAGFRLFRAVPMRMPRKWSHTGDIPLTPSMAKYLCAVPRTSGVFETRFKEYDPSLSEFPDDDGPAPNSAAEAEACPHNQDLPDDSAPAPKASPASNAAKEASSDSEETARSQITHNDEPTSPADAEQEASEGTAATALNPPVDAIMLDDCQADPAARPDGGSLGESTPREILMTFKPMCQPSRGSLAATVDNRHAPSPTRPLFVAPRTVNQDAYTSPRHRRGPEHNLLRRAATWPDLNIASNYCAYGAILLAAADFRLLCGLFTLFWSVFSLLSLLRFSGVLGSLNAGGTSLVLDVRGIHPISGLPYCKLASAKKLDNCPWCITSILWFLFVLWSFCTAVNADDDVMAVCLKHATLRSHSCSEFLPIRNSNLATGQLNPNDSHLLCRDLTVVGHLEESATTTAEIPIANPYCPVNVTLHRGVIGPLHCPKSTCTCCQKQLTAGVLRQLHYQYPATEVAFVFDLRGYLGFVLNPDPQPHILLPEFAGLRISPGNLLLLTLTLTEIFTFFSVVIIPSLLIFPWLTS